MPDAPGLPFWAAVATGFGLAVSQAVSLREVLVLTAGFEPSVGPALAAWLAWTGVGGLIGSKSRFSPLGVAACLCLLSLLAPATLVALRASRSLWGVPAGALPPLPAMLGICFTALAPLCLAGGLAFALLWAWGTRARGRGMAVFAGEALGAALGGLALTFAMLPALSAPACLALAGTATAVAALACAPLSGRRPALRLMALACLGANIGLLAAAPAVDRATLSLAWGAEPLAARDTRVQNLVLFAGKGQATLFGSGAWLMTEPDKRASELAVHPVLLQVQPPGYVLLLGGSPLGPVREALRHPGVASVTWVQGDRGVVDLAKDMARPVEDGRVRLVVRDPAVFMASDPGPYDAVLLDAGDPWSLAANRLYTEEFFRRVRKVLKPGGVFSFALTFAPDAPGPGQVAYVRTMARTLEKVFPQVAVYPGDRARFVATDRESGPVRDWRVLDERAKARGLDLDFVRGEYLFDTMSPWRLAWMESLIRGKGPDKVNRALDPAGFFRAYALRAAQASPRLKPVFSALAGLDKTRAVLWAGVVALALALLPALRPGRLAVGHAVLVAGGASMAMETGLLLGFQMAVGSLYGMLALVTSAFMAGLAAGGAWVLVRPDRGGGARPLALVHALVAAAPMGVYAAVAVAVEHGPEISEALATTGFAACSAALGCLGGLHFGLAARVAARLGARPESLGGGLYAWDMAGAALFSVLAGLVLLPALGFAACMGVAALLAASALPGLARLVPRLT